MKMNGYSAAELGIFSLHIERYSTFSESSNYSEK